MPHRHVTLALRLDHEVHLTACQGCTKKHAKCSWKDVREEELRDDRSIRDPTSPEDGQVSTDAGYTEGPVEDSLLGSRAPTAAVTQGEGYQESHPHEPNAPTRYSMVEDSTHAMPEASTPPPAFSEQLREAASSATNILANGRGHHHNYHVVPRLNQSIEQDDHDEGDRLQALAAQVYRSASQSVRPQET